MRAITIKYMPIAWGVILFFGNINCDNLSLQISYDDAQLYREIGCTAECMNINFTMSLSKCYGKCKMSNQTVTLQRMNVNEAIRPICRRNDSMAVEVYNRLNNSRIGDDESWTNYNTSIFLIKLQANNSQELRQRTVCISNTSVALADHLQKNTTYAITASIFNGRFEYRQLEQTQYFKTLDRDAYVPQKISNDTFQMDYARKQNTSTLLTTIKWESAADMVCDYRFHLYAKKQPPTGPPIQGIDRNLQIQELNHLVTDVLLFETEYILQIHGFNAKHEMIEGNMSSFEFTTRTCYNITGYDHHTCPPLPIANISSNFEIIGHQLYNIDVMWGLPKYLPAYYTVSLNDFSIGNFKSKNVTGEKSATSFFEVHVSDVSYDVIIEAFSSGGSTKSPSVSFPITKNDYSSSAQYDGPIRAIGMLLLFLLGISFIFVVIQNRRKKLKHKKELASKEMYLRKLVQSHNIDKMEIDPANVELFELLGEGNFGIVRKGILKPDNKSIAVKMLKEYASIEDVQEFLSEITLMKSVGHHENIVGIIGHATKLNENMMLLTEYCSKGNLLSYLRDYQETLMPKHFDLVGHKSDLLKLSLFEKLPEDIFNFDSKFVEKFTRNNKSLSVIDEGNINNMVSNKLYETTMFNSKHSNIQTQSKFQDDVEHSGENDLKLCLVSNGLFAENVGYFSLASSENCSTVSHECERSQSIKHQQSNEDNEVHQQLTGKDLLLFALQIATGMEFLANNKIVHRDLAARNVLVCADRTVKIADFGLSRDIYVDNIYMKSSAGRLPIKWLALESMMDQKYTSQSDVWSYGILLFEIATLGCTPYPTIPVDCLVSYLKSGGRMSKPHNCSQQFYDLMLSCWNCEPSERPTFAELRQQMDWFIQHLETNEVFTVGQFEKKEWSKKMIEMQKRCSSPYLKPLNPLNP